MRCVNCDTELIAGKRFCHVCGTRAPLVCTVCGSTIEASFRFCPDCGTGLSADSAPTAAGDAAAGAAEATATEQRLAHLALSIPEQLAAKIRASQSSTGERKLVTVLFCDLVGSTTIAERLDPEEYRELLEEYMEIAFREVYLLEGIVNHLAGDGVMALFGAPLAHEDAPQRAVQAALAIRAALGGLNERVRVERGLELQVRIGIHTGPVVVGTVGNDLKMDYTAIGDTTNLAARLQSLADPGTILMSEATHRLVRGAFHTRAIGPLEVRGKSDPVDVHEVLGVREALTPMAIAEARGMTPLVGRAEELDQLNACYRRLAGNLAQVVAVVGEAGSGKSRLLYEFKQRLAGEPVVFFEARCASLTQLVPYAPIIGMLRQFFAVTPSAPLDDAAAKIMERLEQAGLDSLYPFFARLLSLPGAAPSDLPPDELRRQTFEAVAHLVVDTSERTPVMFTIEDLHWIDDSSREMIELAVTRMRSKAVMMMVSHRPDYQPSWRTQAAFTQLNLRALTDEEATEIVRAVAGGTLPAELERRILLRAEGNPFFAEEITRALLEEGLLVRTNGRVRLTQPVARMRIPDTVQELVGARLDRLGQRAKRVVQVAAVLGRQFSRAHVTRLLEGEGIDVSTELEQLERRGVIHRKTVLSNDEFRFGESLTQEVAYEGLLLRQRRELHERIGLMLETSAKEPTPELSALLAHHFARSDNRLKALRALVRAGKDAESIPSYRTAVGFFRQAFELAEAALDASQGVGDDLRLAALEASYGLLRIAVLFTSSDAADVERAARRSRELAEQLGDQNTLAGVLTFHGMLMMSGDHERFAQGLALVEEGLTVAHRAGDALGAMRISRGLAWSYVLDGRFELAERTITWTVKELERLGHRERLSDVYMGALWIQDGVRFYSERLDAAHEGALETYELALKAPNRTAACGSAATLAGIFLLRADYQEAKRWADRGLEIAEVIGNIAALRSTAAIALIARVELGESVATARYVELIQQGVGVSTTLPLHVRYLVDAFLAIGDLKRAERLLEIRQGHAGGRLQAMLSASAIGDVLLQLGPHRWDEAERCFDEAATIAGALGARATLATATIGAAELAIARGDRDTGRRRLEQALEICQEIGLVRYQARAARALAELDGVVQRRA